MPTRSPAALSVIPPSPRMPLVVRRLTTLLRDAGPLHDATVCSQTPQVARFAETETPDPLLVPGGTRAVSYGLHACPLQEAYARSVVGNAVGGRLGPAAPADSAKVTLLAAEIAKIIAPLLRSMATSVESAFGTSIAKLTSLP